MLKVDAQLAVFLDNRPGMLARMCQALAKAHVNILALSVLDTVDHAIIRMVVDKPKEAERVLEALPALVQVRDVHPSTPPPSAGSLGISLVLFTRDSLHRQPGYPAVGGTRGFASSLFREFASPPTNYGGDPAKAGLFGGAFFRHHLSMPGFDEEKQMRSS